MAGFNDYHMRQVVANGINDCLNVAREKQPDEDCDPLLFNTVTMTI
jgi:hypothetical protein